MDDATIRELAERLMTAEHKRLPTDPLTAAHPAMTAEDAYAVQQTILRTRLESGDSIVGWKVGLTSEAMQAMLGVDTPDYGPILSSMLVNDRGTIAASDLIQPKAEAEIAFVLDRSLRGPGVTPSDVARATAGVVASIEVIDSRIRDWKIALADTVADMASSARVVTSELRVPLEDLDLREVGVAVRLNGGTVETGKGAAVLGDPLSAVAWAANTLGALGVTLEAGQLIMPGAMHRAVDVAAGDTIQATFDELGPVEVRFA